MPDEELLTTQEVADRLKVKLTTVQRWLKPWPPTKEPRLRGVKLPNRAGWRVPESEVERMLRGE